MIYQKMTLKQENLPSSVERTVLSKILYEFHVKNIKGEWILNV